MNMQNALHYLHTRLGRLWVLVFVVVGMTFLFGTNVLAQTGSRHYMYEYGMPPGEIAFRKTLARHAMAGYFQPVRFIVPKGAQIEVFSEGQFRKSTGTKNVAGLMVGNVYRLKVTNIPGHPGKEVYPSVEIMGRLFPPQSQAWNFPIPVKIGLVDLEPAMTDALVSRVVYLENPRTAIAEQRSPDDQPFFDVGTSQDPIRAAERFGRPMILVRIGSRIPDSRELNAFGFGTPPMIWNESPPGDQGGADETQTAVSNDISPESSLEASSSAFFAQPHPMSQLPPWPDELLIDGGDRGLKALVKDFGNRWEVRGLDAEDTIAHFDTLDGRRIVDTSNRVAIYAPRFSAIRKLDRMGTTKYTNQPGSTQEGIAASSSRRTDFSSTTLQNIQPSRNKRLTPVVGVENHTRGVRIENGIQMRLFEGSFKTYENLRLIRTGFKDNREKGRLAISIDRAISWDGDVSAQSTTDNLRVTVVRDIKKALETVHVKTELDRPQIRLVKVASVDAAHPGDVVDFTIRFDNVGDQPIGNVTIIDNLTGRLAYVAGSAECSLPGDFLSEPNKSGSQILRWEINDPLPATKGGVIRFQCRVR